MTFLIISDDDSVIAKIPEARADVLISCGDLSDESILKAATRCGPKQIIAVKGNHDSASNFPNPTFNLHLQTTKFQGVTFGGFGGSWKYKPKGHHLYEQNEVEAALKDFPKVDVFVAHNSPAQVHDKDDFVHAGFSAFNSYIARESPKLFIHGHQHIQKESVIGLTRVVGVFGFQFMVFPT